MPVSSQSHFYLDHDKGLQLLPPAVIRGLVKEAQAAQGTSQQGALLKLRKNTSGDIHLGK